MNGFLAEALKKLAEGKSELHNSGLAERLPATSYEGLEISRKTYIISVGGFGHPDPATRHCIGAMNRAV